MTNCPRCNRTQCRRKYASGWLRHSPGSLRPPGERRMRSPSFVRSRMPSGQGSLSIGFTGGLPTRLLCNSRRKWLKCSRYVTCIRFELSRTRDMTDLSMINWVENLCCLMDSGGNSCTGVSRLSLMAYQACNGNKKWRKVGYQRSIMIFYT